MITRIACSVNAPVFTKTDGNYTWSTTVTVKDETTAETTIRERTGTARTAEDGWEQAYRYATDMVHVAAAYEENMAQFRMVRETDAP